MDDLTIERAGTTLHARHRPGAGSPLVIVPGVMADAAGWQGVVDALDTARPVLVLDRRGRHPSGPLGSGYDVRTEVEDLLAWLATLGAGHEAPATVVGWSYGALIALEAATRTAVIEAVIGYEPVLAPFGADQLPALDVAAVAGDLDLAVTIVNRDVSHFGQSYTDELRSTPTWAQLLPLAAPLPDELRALNNFEPQTWHELTIPVTLIIGSVNVGAEPYGTAFERVLAELAEATVIELTGEGHLAHATAPAALGRLISGLLDERD